MKAQATRAGGKYLAIARGAMVPDFETGSTAQQLAAGFQALFMPVDDTDDPEDGQVTGEGVKAGIKL